MIEEDKCLQNIIIDNGSGNCRAGLFDDNCKIVFPCILGRPKVPSLCKEIYSYVYIGDEIPTRGGIIILSRPINRGIITNLEEMTHIWNHTFYNELREDPNDKTVLLSESPLNSKATEEKITEVFFENFGVSSFMLGNRVVLPMYSEGRTIGTVIQSGFGVTNIASIFEGNMIPETLKTLPIGGEDLTDYLCVLLKEQFYYFSSRSERDLVREIKERMCLVSSDFQSDIRKSLLGNINETLYEFPDGNSISLNSELFRCPEFLFTPSINEKKEQGMLTVVNESIQKAASELQPILYKNIVLSGGNTMFKGLSDRLTKEMQKFTPSTISVTASPERKYSAWMGGAIASSLSSFQQEKKITKEEFEEIGSAIIHKKRL